MKNSIQDSANCISLENPANWSDSLLISNPLPKGTGMLIAIDPNVADYPMLAAGAYEGASVLILDPNRDGIEQITTALQGSELTSLHIVCHGSPGCLHLGNTPLNLKTLDRYASTLQTMSRLCARQLMRRIAWRGTISLPSIYRHPLHPRSHLPAPYPRSQATFNSMGMALTI